MKICYLYSVLLLLVLALSVKANPVTDSQNLVINDLTPIGAQRAANDDGSIPEWTGGIKALPIGYKIGDHHIDPYEQDKVFLQIDFTNSRKYRNLLSPGVNKLINIYHKSFKLNVYPTRRSASYPDFYYDASQENILTASMTENGEGITGTAIGIPFPLPNNGMEVMWNHLVRFRGEQVKREVGQAVVNRNGDARITKYQDQFLMSYSKQSCTVDLVDQTNTLFQYKQFINTPVKTERSALLVNEPLNQVVQSRQAWSYTEATHRVERNPSINYDNASVATDGLRRVDEFDMFNGALDRFEWQLLGKTELLIPYNNYKLHSNTLKNSDVLHPGHINPDLVRWEKHRVWVVQATRKNIDSHIYKKRVYYIDEDSWQIHLVDVFNHHDELIRVGIAYTINYYEVPTLWTTLEVFHDLKQERYVAFGLNNEYKMYDFITEHQNQEYTPSSLRRRN